MFYKVRNMQYIAGKIVDVRLADGHMGAWLADADKDGRHPCEQRHFGINYCMPLMQLPCHMH